MAKNLQALRGKIDKLDLKLQNNLIKREILVKEIAKIKAKMSVPAKDSKREKEIISKIENPYVKKVFKSILAESRKIQK